MIVIGQRLSVAMSGRGAACSDDAPASECRTRTEDDGQEEQVKHWHRSQARRRSIVAGASPALVATALLLIALTSATLELTEARYIHSTYRFSPSYAHEQPFGNDEGERPAGMGMARRQDYEGDEDADDDGDQSAAASYRNQDNDNGAGDGGGGGSGDNYGDNETDGPYDETPNEQEGQADLERFFDDHLGASDREGMDKENLPTNLVALLASAPVRLNPAAGLGLGGLPVGGLAMMDSSPGRAPTQLTAVPLLPVINPTVQPSRPAIGPAHESLPEPLSSLPTIQTSFIRLPDEKMLITHQVTARNAGADSADAASNPRAQLANGGGGGPPRPLKFSADEQGASAGGGGSGPDQAGGDQHASGRPHQLTSQMAAALDGHGWHLLPQLVARQQLRISPTESLANTSTGNLTPIGGDSPAISASGSNSNDVFATEDEDFDRVYVTNETSRPFRIDALGGFDPEEDFIDAAKELEVMASDDNPGRARARGRAAAAGGSSTSETATGRGLKRRSNQAQEGHDSGAASNSRTSRIGGGGGSGEASEQQQQQQQQGDGDAQPGQEVSFNDPEMDMMYEDASETDEVTFGQDDPYQTDLEAEMRQQEYDKLSPSSVGGSGGVAGQQTNDQPSVSGSLNVAVDNGAGGANGGTSNANQQVGGGEEDDIDADMDNEYRPELNARQRESMAASTKSAQVPRPRNDIDDEGAWVNDGVDEMDIPSQSHQNSVLDKAEQRADVAAAAELAAKNDEDDGKQPTADGDAATAGQDESGQTNDHADENVRMPNADYLKNDFVEDDSGYAAA